MHTEILDKKRLSILRRISENISGIEYYMAGGTGLSLQMGLRKSYDFDFFTTDSFTPNAIYEQLKSFALEKIEAINVDDTGTCDVVLDGVQVSFFRYPYKLVSDLVNAAEIHGLNIAGITDIAAMKAIAIGNRGAKKDFFDLYNILVKLKIGSNQLLHWLRSKYGDSQNLVYIAYGMNYFEDAEQEELPEAFVEYDWEEIKNFFNVFQKDFINSIEHMETEKKI